MVPQLQSSSPRASMALVAFALVISCAVTRVRAAEPSPQSAPAAPRTADETARLLRFHAGAQAEALREALERAKLDDGSREGLKALVRDHLKRVEDAVSKASAAGGAAATEPLDDLLDRAADLARDFNDKRVAAWLDEHPAAFQPVQEQIALAEAYQRALVEEPEAIVRTARAGHLPAEREGELRKTVTAAHDRLAEANAAAEKPLREAEEKAAAAQPAGPAPAPPAEARPLDGQPPDDRRAPPRGGAPGAAPGAPPDGAPPPLPRPLTPEEKRLQLLDALAFVDAHARTAAAARDVRAEVEKLLPDPSQRQALMDDLLRWYQTPPPGSEPPRDTPGREGAVPQQQKQRQQEPPPPVAPPR